MTLRFTGDRRRALPPSSQGELKAQARCNPAKRCNSATRCPGRGRRARARRPGQPLVRERRPQAQKQPRLLCGLAGGGPHRAEVPRPAVRRLPLGLDGAAGAPAPAPRLAPGPRTGRRAWRDLGGAAVAPAPMLLDHLCMVAGRAQWQTCRAPFRAPVLEQMRCWGARTVPAWRRVGRCARGR